MAIIIAGTTGLAELDGYDCTEPDGPPWAIYTSPYTPTAFQPAPFGAGDRGFSIDSDFIVTVPLGALPGTYTGILPLGYSCSGGSTEQVKKFEFNVVTGVTRYHCVDGHCQSFLAADETSGYESCAAAGCAVLGVGRHFCDNCAAIVADADPDTGYASQEECEAACPPAGGWWVCPEAGADCHQDPTAESGYATNSACSDFCSGRPEGGWWLCNPESGFCLQDPGAVSGYATEAECLMHCSAPPGCTLDFTLTSSFISPTQIRLDARVTGAHDSLPATTFLDQDGADIGIEIYDLGRELGAIHVLSHSYGLLPGETQTFTVTITDSGCTPVTRTITVTNPAETGDCSSQPPLTLTWARTTGTTFRVTASKPASFAYATGGAIVNESATTCLISVAAGANSTVKAHAMVGSCAFDAQVTIDGDDASGGASVCTVKISLGVEDLGEAMYRFTAVLSDVQSGAPVVHWVDGGGVPSDAGFPLQYTVNIPLGTSKIIVATVVDGTCAAGDALVVKNSDSEGAGTYPPVVPDDDCVAAIGNYVRDFKAELFDDSKVIYRARFGFELRDDCLNPACRKFFQAFQSSDPTLMGIYTDEALDKHVPLALEVGQSQPQFGDRPQRRQIVAGDTMRPATDHVHLRITENPVYELWPLDTVGNVVKIRDWDGKSSFVFTNSPARLLQYKPPEAGKIGADRAGTLTVLQDLGALGATDALDACIVADKIYVSRSGEVFAVDTDTGQNTYHSGIRGESGTVFLETVGSTAFILYVDTATRAYSLDFPSGKPLWTLPHTVTKTQVADDKLLLAVGADLYITDPNASATAPTLEHTFPATITALAKDYVGLSNAHIYRKFSTGWTDVTTLTGPVGATWPWLGGAEELRALAGAASGSGAGTLKAEQTSLNWTPDRTLTTATGIRAMRSLSIEITPMTATTPAVIDERMLIGDDHHRLWVYSQATIPPGAVQGCHISIPRIETFTRVRGEGE